MSKKDYPVRNWKDYTNALVNRGSITLWINEKSIGKWYEENKTKLSRDTLKNMPISEPV